MEFVLGRFSHFNIAIAYSNSTFCGAWTLSFCEFTWKPSKYQQNEHTPGCFWNESTFVLGCARFPEFVQNFSEHQILWSLCSVDFHTLILQLPIQTPHSVAPELQVFMSSLENCQNFSKTSTPLAYVVLAFVYCSGVCSFCWNFSERQILWSLCSVDFHTLTLQLPIQTPHSVAPELQVFVSSLKISAKRAHPRGKGGLGEGKSLI